MNAAPPLHPNEQTLRAYGLGQLTEDAAAGVDSHLEGCPDCRRRVADLSGDSFLSRLRGSARGVADARPATNDDALPPELSSQYELVRELGRGGMGVVWLARNKLLDRLEALKILNKAMLERRGTLDRFLREIRVVAQLNHENVVRAYSALQVGDALVFVLEYVEGLDLARLVKSKGPLPVAHACYFVYQAALGLQHAHERGMVHRDIKPGNLILHKQGQRAVVKVLDFGLAKALSEQSVDGSLTHEGQMLGTPDYIAPEQTLDAQKADIRADIYSLGCTLYYLLSGAPPFSGTSLYDILQAHHSMDARPLNLLRPEVPAELAAAVGKMMAKDPLRRFQTPREVSLALAPFFKSAPAATPPKPAPVDSPRREAQDDPPPASEPKWASLIEFQQTERSAVVPVRPAAAPADAPARRRGWVWPAVAAALVLVGALTALGVVLRLKTQYGDLEVEGLPAGAVVVVDRSAVTLDWQGEGGLARVKVSAGPHRVTVTVGGVEVHGEEVTIAAGAGKRIRIRARPPAVAVAKPLEPRARVESVFNGRDLSGWKDLLANGSQWQIVDGELQGRGGGERRPAVLVLESRRLTSFRLRFQARYPRPGGGWVELRRTASGESGLNTSCYAFAQGAWPSHVDPAGSGGIARNYEYGSPARGEVIGTAEPLATNRWHSYEFRVENNRITTTINGKIASEFTDADELYPCGTIALAVNGLDEAQFREIELEEIPDDALPGPRSAIPGRFAALFNGKDIFAWNDIMPNGSMWTVTDGVIEGRGGGDGNPGVLVLGNQRFTNFRLRFQVRYPENGFGWVELRRSGIEVTDGFYAVAHGVLERFAPVGSVIRTEHARYGQRREKWDYEPKRTPFVAGEWHRFLITVVNHRIQTVVDGQPVGDYVDPDAMHGSGTIALACGAVDTTVQYKDILIETLPEDTAVSEPRPTHETPVPQDANPAPAEQAAAAPAAPASAPSAAVGEQPAAKPTTAARPKPRNRSRALPQQVANGIDMRLRLIPAGGFLMGSSSNEGEPPEHPQHPVAITRPFYLGVYEVTQKQYSTIMGNNPSQFRDDENKPVERVSWIDAVKFCNALSEREGLPPFYRIDGDAATARGGQGYRLPTEAEWEYACRAGTTTPFPFPGGDAELGRYAWYGKNAGNTTHPVGQKQPNAVGLHDMLGNVWEWCHDVIDRGYYPFSPAEDPTGPNRPAPPPEHVCRGGVFNNNFPGHIRSAYRGGGTGWLGLVGFRVARTAP